MKQWTLQLTISIMHTSARNWELNVSRISKNVGKMQNADGWWQIWSAGGHVTRKQMKANQGFSNRGSQQCAPCVQPLAELRDQNSERAPKQKARHLLTTFVMTVVHA